MKRWLLFIIATTSFASILTTAQTPANVAPTTLNFENGVIANGGYSNECFGFSLPIPAGWKIDESIIVGGKARHRSEKSLVLLYLRQAGDSIGRIILSAAVSGDQTSSAQDFVSTAVHEQIKVSPDRELVRDAFAIDYGGLHFYRSDYKGLLGGKDPLYFAYVYTRFRGYMVGETIVSASPQGLDEAANSLQPISFQEDQINPKCVMAPEEPAPKTATPQRVRVSSGVSQGLLIKKVTPAYPDQARWARIQGQVFLQAEIDKNGDIQNLKLISGHAMLVPAAIEAVKQWKYKPYLFQGQPVAVETQILVNFTLTDR
jgi:TonB family protein